LGSILYMLLNLLRGVSPVGSLLLEASVPAQTALALYWGLFFHHYYLDQKIWRVRRSPSLQREFGMEPA
jgi:hypothetical protein